MTTEEAPTSLAIDAEQAEELSVGEQRLIDIGRAEYIGKVLWLRDGSIRLMEDTLCGDADEFFDTMEATDDPGDRAMQVLIAQKMVDGHVRDYGAPRLEE